MALMGVGESNGSSAAYEAIKSAIFPKKTNYLYFIKALNGKKHIFSSTYKQHIKTIKHIKNKR